MNKYRSLIGKELLSLKGKWLRMKGSTAENLVTDILPYTNEIKIGKGFQTSKELLENWTHEDGTPVGKIIELSHDGYTRKELERLTEEGCTNLECNRDGEWSVCSVKLNKNQLFNSNLDIGKFRIKVELSADSHTLKEFTAKANEDGSNVEVLNENGSYSKIYSGLTNLNKDTLKWCRIKPTQYIRPKAGFRGSVMCETSDDRRTWKRREVVAVVTKEEAAYPFCTPITSYQFARLLPFSADNPPPVGTKLRQADWDEESFARYAEPIDKEWFSTEKDGDYEWSKNWIWIDYEEVLND